MNLVNTAPEDYVVKLCPVQTRDKGRNGASDGAGDAGSGSPQLHIFIISYLYEENIRAGMGGFQKVFELGRQFSRNHQVALFLPAYSRHTTDLECVWIPVINLSWLRLLSFNFFLIPALVIRALKGRPNVIYQRIFNAFTSPLLARLLGATFVIEFNGNPLQFYKVHNRSRKKWLRALLRWNLRSADRIVALTEDLKSEIQSDFGVDSAGVYVAPSGSNPELFHPRDRLECRRELSMAEDSLVAVFAGTFFSYQGIDVLLDALKDLHSESLQVWLVGEGVERAEWESRASALDLRNVQFTGQVEYSQVPLFIGASNFCLAPFDSRRGEVSPLKVMDYLCCARPTIIAQIPAVENLLSEFQSLLPSIPGNPVSLADAIPFMLENQDRFARLAEADSRVSRHRYSWEQIAHRIEVNCVK